jgi:hypothetical protein
MKTISLAVALSLYLPVAAFAQDSAASDPFATERLGGDSPTERPQRGQGASTQRALIPLGLVYASFDTDRNYKVSREELEVGIAQSFAAADRDRSAHLSLVELAAWRELVLGSRDLLPGNTQFDRNFDSRVERAEFTSLLTDLYKSFDRNENGALEYSEMTRPIRQATRSKVERRERIPQRQSRGQRPSQ